MQSTVIQILDAPDYPQEIQRGAELLAAGKLIVLPTETVYGVAGLLTHEAARTALHTLRRSTQRKPLTIHIARRQDALRYLGDVSDLGRRMMKKLWPGPVGLMFDVPGERRREVAAQLELDEAEIYQGSTLILRSPDHPVFFDVVSQVPGPVVLTAAGGAHHRGLDLESDLGNQVETIFDAGETRFSKPSTLVRIKDDRYEIVRAGVYDDRIIQRMLKTTLLFVCSGNTCRSPMAEAIATRFLADKYHVRPDELENKGIYVVSAGSHAMAGARATPQAVDVLKEMGMDLSRHRSQPLTVELIHQADAIFTMTRGHARAVEMLVPSAAEKTSTLDPENDIEDPIGGDISLYNQVAGQIQSLIQQRLNEGVIP